MNIDGINSAQVQSKFNKLRRSFGSEKKTSNISGKGGVPDRIYDVEAHALWSSRPKFTIPAIYGLDTNKIASGHCLNQGGAADIYDQIESSGGEGIPTATSAPITAIENDAGSGEAGTSAGTSVPKIASENAAGSKEFDRTEATNAVNANVSVSTGTVVLFYFTSVEINLYIYIFV